MFGLRSARGRAILAGVVLVVLLAGVAAVAIWRTHDDRQQHHALEHTSAVATALEHAQAQFWETQATLAALILLGDPSLVDDYHDTVASLEQNLSQARTHVLAEGEADEVLALDALTERIGHFIEQVNLALPIVLEADPETRVQLATASMPGMVSDAEAIIADLEALVEAHESDAAATGAAADRAAGTSLWLLIGFSAAAFAVAAGTVAMLIVSVVRPLASLQASARAITSGDLEARANVSGPEEVVSLAHDLNEMTDALSAKTQEYIATTNLTGDLIAKLDKHGNWAFLNDAACQFYGKPREELLGTDSRAFAHPEDLEATAQRIRKTRAGKELHKGFVNRQVTPMGTRVVEWNGYPLFDEEGEYTGIQITGRDITERQQMEEALRESEERYRDLFENANDLIQSVAPDTSLVYVNRAWRQALGYSEDEIPGLSLFDIVHPDSKAHCTEMFQRVMAGEKLDHIEAMFVTKDGRTIWVEGSASCRFEDGKPVATRGIFRDITERKRAEEALRSSEERLRILFEFAPDAYYLHDLEGNFVDANRAAEELIGYKKEDLIGKSLLESNLIPPTQLPKAAATVAKLVQGLPSGPDEFTLIRKDGKHIAVETRGFPVEIGEQTLILGIGRDITQRKRAEQELRLQSEITQNMAEALYLIRASDGVIVYTNPAFERLFGYGPGEMVGKHVSVVNAPTDESPEETAKEIIATLDRTGVWRGEILSIKKDGTLFWSYANVSTFDHPGHGRVWVTYHTDITERKRAEEALRSSEERLRILFEFAPDAYYLNDLQGNFVDGNKAAEEVTGYKREELVGKNMLELKLLPPEQIAKAAAALAQHAQGKPAGPNEFILNQKDGSQVPVEIRAFPVKIKDQTLVLGIARDIGERKQAQDERERLHAELEVRAITDSLTGLYNHAHFFQRLAEEIDRSNRYGRGFSILMMDVDNFKQFNDSRGHQAGDEALCLVADCIRTALRRSDIPFRYGGDEFAAILLHADSSRAQAIAKRMNGCIARRLKKMNNPVAASLGLSTGVACFPQDATTADDLVRIADTALYDAKRATQARRAMQQGQAIDLLAFPSGTLDEKQQRVLSTAAGSLTTILQDVSVPDILADLDLRTIAAVAAAAEIKDPYIRDHQERVSQGAAALAEKMGLPPEQVHDIRVAGLLHDLGKVSISEHILNKPGKLTEEEYAKIKEHPALGAMIVAHVEGLQRLVPIVRHHHERFGGKGYPDGLAGEEIPLEARILSVVDVFDAMTHQRSYRKALSKAEAMAELERGAGTQFDPAAVKAFLALLKKRGDELACPVHAASEAGPLATAKAAGRRKG